MSSEELVVCVEGVVIAFLDTYGLQVFARGLEKPLFTVWISLRVVSKSIIYRATKPELLGLV